MMMPFSPTRNCDMTFLERLFASFLRFPLNEAENNVPTEKELGTCPNQSRRIKKTWKAIKEKQKLGEQQENLPLRGLSMNFSSPVLVAWSCLASIHYWRCGFCWLHNVSSPIFQRFSFSENFCSRLKISGELKLIFQEKLRFLKCGWKF